MTRYRYGVPNATLQRLAAVTPNTTITTAEAAKLAGLSPATRAPNQPAGQQRFRLEDLHNATKRR